MKLKNKIHAFVYAIGKEEIFIKLARMFDTKIVVDKERFRKL